MLVPKLAKMCIRDRHLIVEPYEEGKELPSVFRFNNQEFKITPRDTQTVELAWGGKLIFVNSVVGGAIDNRFKMCIRDRYGAVRLRLDGR